MMASHFKSGWGVLCCLLLLATATLPCSSLVPDCPRQCDCSTFPQDQTVDCIGQGISQVPQVWPQGTLHIHFSHNNLTAIEDTDFTNKSLQTLLGLHLDYNLIERVSNNSFRNLTFLRKLFLNFNRLTSFPKSILQGHLPLTELSLAGNDFSNFTFQPGSLCNADLRLIQTLQLPRLERLDLQESKLFDSSLAEDALTGCYLDNLNLSSNLLTAVGRNRLSGVAHYPSKIDLRNNNIVTISEASGFEQFQLACSLSAGRDKFLYLDNNPYCCNKDMVWIRNFKACSVDIPHCYKRGLQSSSSSLFDYQLSNATDMECHYEPFESSDTNTKWIIIGCVLGGAAVISLVAFLLVFYRRFKKRTKGTSNEESEQPFIPVAQNVIPIARNVIPEAMEVTRDQVKQEELLGEGAYSKVYKAKFNDMVVAKKAFRPAMDDAMVMENFRREVQLLGSLKSYRIVRILGYCCDTDPLERFILLDFMERGSAVDVLRHCSTEGFVNIDVKIQMLYDCALGMEFLHDDKKPTGPFLHLDLKAVNLFVDAEYRLKVGDLGLTHRLTATASKDDPSLPDGDSSENTSVAGLRLSSLSRIGSPRWTAPERFKKSVTITSKTDVYSFAVVIWEFMQATKPCPLEPGKADLFPFPFSNLTRTAEIEAAVLNGERPEQVKQSTPKEIEKLMKECWEQTPKRRPDFTTILTRMEAIADKREITLKDRKGPLVSSAIACKNKRRRSITGGHESSLLSTSSSAQSSSVKTIYGTQDD